MRARTGLVAGAVAALLLAGTALGRDDPAATAESSRAYSSVLGPWFEALESADEAPATVVVMGDSVSEGYGIADDLHLRWVDRLQDSLREATDAPRCPTGPGGYRGTTSLVPARYVAPSLPDPQVTGRARPVDTHGPGGRAVALAPGASISWRAEATEVAIGYRTRPTGGDLQVTVDGEVGLSAERISTQAEEGRREVWHSAERDLRTRTYTVTNVGSRGEVLVTDLTPYRGDRDRCVHVYDASHSGISASSVSGRPEYVSDSLSVNPDLVVVALGYNDARAGHSPDRLRRSLSRLVNLIRNTGYHGPVLLVSWQQPTPGFFSAPWWQYRDAIEATANGSTTTYLDIGAVMPPIATAQTGTYFDPLHPGLRGQQIIAAAMTRGLTRPEVTPPRER